MKTKLKKMTQKVKKAAAAAVVGILTAPAAMASAPSAGGSGLPWEGPLNIILASIQGPVARVFLLLSIIATGIGLAFGEHGSGFKKVMGIAFGGAIIISAVSFVSTLFGATF